MSFPRRSQVHSGMPEAKKTRKARGGEVFFPTPRFHCKAKTTGYSGDSSLSKKSARTHETGILLSIGVSKVKVIAQHILETLMIAVIAFGLSYFSSGAIVQGTSNRLFSQAAET